MKKIISILAYLTAFFVMQSCDKYLDLVPKGQSVLNSTSDYLGLLEDISGISIDEERYLCGEVTGMNLQALKDYKIPLQSAAFFWNEEYDRAQYMNHTQNTDNYGESYRMIAKFNIIIENIMQSQGKEEEKIAGLAQAKIMRAYHYFFLINTYAKQYNPQTAATDRGIILRSEFSIEKEGVQGTVAQAYELIQKDIEEALPTLPAKSLNNFRPDKAFGYALKAKVHLFKREITEALTAAETAIKTAESNGHKLWDMNIEYKQVRDGMGSMYPFPMPESDFWPNGMMYSMVTSMSFMYFDHSYNDPENLLYQHGVVFMDPAPMFIRKEVLNLFNANTDLRHLLCLLKMGRPTSEPGALQFIVSNIKWNVSGMRLSEVYLMLAECYARKDDPKTAMLHLNQLRKFRHRASMYKDFSATSGEEALKMVREERKRELMLTVNGFFDMKRFAAEFNETHTKTIEGKTYTLKPGSHLYIQPFPVAAMQNSNLTQNSK